MTPSLPTLPAAPAVSGCSPDIPTNLQINQDDIGFPGDFRQLLGQAFGTLPTGPAAEPVVGAGDQDLSVELLSLPEDGNLLPLLQQLIGGTEAAGVDPREVLERIIARLERTGTQSGRDAAEHLQHALQQLLKGDTEQAAVLPSQAAALAAYRPVDEALGVSPDAAGKRQPQVVDQLQLSDRGTAEQGKLSTEAGREQQGFVAHKLFEPGNQLSLEAGQRSCELLAALTVLRPAGSGLKPATAVSATGAEQVSAVIHQTVPPAGGPAGSSATPTVSVDVPLQQGNWDQALGERIHWLMGQRLQGAQIKLNPAHLGPMEVRIQVQHDQANIQFTSAHAVVREALEAALPRLRDMFESAGVQLLNVDVSGQSAAHQRGTPEGREPPAWQRFSSGRHEGVDTVLETAADGRVMSGRLDLFA